MDGVESPELPHHKSGHRVFDFVVSGSAVLISCVSLFIAVQHGRTMEKLVEANSFPNAELGGSIDYTNKPDELSLGVSVQNTGVGPARIESIELWENGKPIRSATDIAEAIKSASGGLHGKGNVEGDSVIEALIGAGKANNFIRFKFSGIKAWYPPLTKVLFGLESRVCYCSVFDECHISDSRVSKGRPVSVKRCPKPAFPYDDNLSRLAMSQSLDNERHPSDAANGGH